MKKPVYFGIGIYTMDGNLIYCPCTNNSFNEYENDLFQCCSCERLYTRQDVKKSKVSGQCRNSVIQPNIKEHQKCNFNSAKKEMIHSPKRILHLTLKKHWFELIESGEKREEYREIKPYWSRRLADIGTEYDAVKFRNGYRKDSPTIMLWLEGVFCGKGRDEWGAPNERVYILRLGEIIGA